MAGTTAADRLRRQVQEQQREADRLRGEIARRQSQLDATPRGYGAPAQSFVQPSTPPANVVPTPPVTQELRDRRRAILDKIAATSDPMQKRAYMDEYLSSGPIPPNAAAEAAKTQKITDLMQRLGRETEPRVRQQLLIEINTLSKKG